MKPNNLLDYETEYTKLIKNNRCLAKALANEKKNSKQYSEDVIALQKKLYLLSALNMQYEKIINKIFLTTKQSLLNNCIEFSNNLTNVAQLCQEGLNIQKTLSNENTTENSPKGILKSLSTNISHKTHAVKPMVGGHVILHPTINLSRLTQINITSNQSVQRTQQNFIADNSEENSVNHNNDVSLNDFLETNDSEESLEENWLDNENSISTRRLEPVVEESEEENINNSILKEARVLLEPLSLEDQFPFKQQRKKNFEKRCRNMKNEDPLEGTSTLLDTVENGERNCYMSKPRQVTKRTRNERNEGYYSDSEESLISEKQTKKSDVKRKFPSEKKDVTGLKYKVKRKKVSEENSGNSLNETQNENRSNNNNSSEEYEFITTTNRNRRTSSFKVYAEPSLKRKLRR